MSKPFPAVRKPNVGTGRSFEEKLVGKALHVRNTLKNFKGLRNEEKGPTSGQLRDLEEHESALLKNFWGRMPKGCPHAKPTPLAREVYERVTRKTLRRWRYKAGKPRPFRPNQQRLNVGLLGVAAD